MTGPTVAVCIPAHGDPSGLETLLELLGRDASSRREEVLVVVSIDGPDEALEDVADRHAATFVVSDQNRGSYAARNRALDVLPDSIRCVLFTDTDCLPQAGWVEAHVRALASHALSGGRVDVLQPSPPTPASFLDAHWHLRQERHLVEEGFAATANLGVRRDVIERFRFDASRRSGGDRELCRRVGAAGHELVYTPDALVLHPARSAAGDLIEKVDRIAAGIRHDRDRPALPRRTLHETARLVRAAQRAGAIRSAGDVMELLSLDRHRSRVVRSAILSA